MGEADFFDSGGLQRQPAALLIILALSKTARRIGELVPAEQGKRTDKEPRQSSAKLSLPHQRLSEFCKLVVVGCSADRRISARKGTWRQTRQRKQ